MKFGKSIVTEIIKIVDTTCQILRLKCTKFDFSPKTTPPLSALPPLGPRYSAIQPSILRPPGDNDSSPDLGVLE